MRFAFRLCAGANVSINAFINSSKLGAVEGCVFVRTVKCKLSVDE